MNNKFTNITTEEKFRILEMHSKYNKVLVEQENTEFKLEDLPQVKKIVDFLTKIGFDKLEKDPDVREIRMNKHNPNETMGITIFIREDVTDVYFVDLNRNKKSKEFSFPNSSFETEGKKKIENIDKKYSRREKRY